MTLALPYKFGSGTGVGRQFYNQLEAVLEYLLAQEREKLTAPLTINVPADYATIPLAYAHAVADLDFGGQAVKIKVANGAYTATLNVTQPWTGGGSLTIEGDTATPSNVTWTTTAGHNVDITANLPGVFTVQGFKHSTITSGNVFQHSGGGLFQYGACEFAACVNNHVFCRSPGSNIVPISSYSISGGANTHLIANNGGTIRNVSLITVTVSGTPAFGTAFAFSTNVASILANLLTFSGAATGMRYSSNGNSVIFTNNGGPNWFPGSIPGTTGSGGQYL